MLRKYHTRLHSDSNSAYKLLIIKHKLMRRWRTTCYNHVGEMFQTTIARESFAEGVGLHTGVYGHVRLAPAPAETGIVFRRVDLDNFHIEAQGQNVARVSYATSLMKQGVLLSTTEHLLAAIYSCGIDNIYIDIDSIEVPILDGVDVDINVVDAARVNGGKQMLRSGEQNALFHEAGGIANASDVLPLRFDMKIVQVNAAKNDAGFGRGGGQTHVTVHPGMEAHTLGKGLSGNGSLEHFPNIILACCSPTINEFVLYYQ